MKPARRTQRGSALLAAVFVIAIVASIGSGLLFLAQNELRLTDSLNDERVAFHLAEAGIEAGRMTLMDVNGSGTFSDDLAVSAGADLALTMDPAMLRGLYLSGVPAVSGAGDDQPLCPATSLTGTGVRGGFYATYLSNDPVEGIGNQTDINRRVMMTSVGVSARGAMETVQAIIEPFPALPTIPSAALTMLGPPPVFDNGNSGSQSHTGADCPGGGGTPGLFVPIVGTTESASQAAVQGQMNRPANFSSGGLSGTDTVADLTDPNDPAMQQSGLPPIAPPWLDCAQVAQLVLDLISEADFYCNTDNGPCNVPAGNAGDIVVIDGDTHAGHFDAGLLLVTGTLSYGGSNSWDGIVLVLGEGRLFRNGGGNGQNTGAVILANIDPSPNGARADKSDWCDNDFESTVFQVSGGGNSSLSYCSDEIVRNDPVRTYRVAEFLQR